MTPPPESSPPPSDRPELPRPEGAKCESIYDLAAQTGLSVSTISRVLNQRGRISEPTRRRVLAAARAAGFRPRSSVRQNTVAIVMDRFRYAIYGGFISAMLTHLVAELARYDLAVEVYTEDNVDSLGTRFVDGVLAVSWDPSTIEKLAKLVDVPIVLINRADLPEFSIAATDHFQGGKLVGQYFLDHGHQRIAVLAEERDWGAVQRIEGIRSALAEQGLPPDFVAVAFTEHQPVYGALKRLISGENTALFLAGEDLTLEASYVLGEMLHVVVPRDISVIGLENARISQFVKPPLTSLAQPMGRLAAAAWDLIAKHIHTHDPTPKRVIIANELIERDSVAVRGK